MATQNEIKSSIEILEEEKEKKKRRKTEESDYNHVLKEDGTLSAFSFNDNYESE